MTKVEMLQGLAVLKVYGLTQDITDKVLLKFWFEDLSHLPMEKYEKAVIALRKAHTTWYPSDNIPALILEQVGFLPKKPSIPAVIREIGEWRAKQKLLNQGGE